MFKDTPLNSQKGYFFRVVSIQAFNTNIIKKKYYNTQKEVLQNCYYNPYKLSYKVRCSLKQSSYLEEPKKRYKYSYVSIPFVKN